MTTAEKSEAVLRKMVELANAHGRCAIERDWNDTFAVTFAVGGYHTHVGIPDPDGSWEQLVGSLYDSLHGGPGLSWVGPLAGETP